MTFGNAHFGVSPGVGRRVASQNDDGAATRSRTKRRSGKNGAPTAEARSGISVSKRFREENASKRRNIETERRRATRVGSANVNKTERFLTTSKKRRAATNERRQNGAIDEKRRKQRTKPRKSRRCKTALTPRRSRRRGNVVRNRRTQTLDDGGWVTLITAKGKGERFLRRPLRKNGQIDDASAKIGKFKRVARARRSEARTARTPAFSSDSTPLFYRVDVVGQRGAARFPLI